MNHPAFAILWAMWAQHRRRLLGCAVGLAVIAVVYPLIFSYTRNQAAVIASIIPLISIYASVMNALLVVDEEGSLSSGSPRHRFAYPVSTQTLVMGPMACAWLGAGFLWVLTATLVYRRSGFDTPIVLPALGMAALMMWVQAVSWLPIGNEWVRVLLTVVVLGMLAGVPLWLVISVEVPDSMVAALLLGYSVAAVVLGSVSVESDRRGQVWRLWPERLRGWSEKGGSGRTVQVQPFRSAAAAQFWYEWRCHGIALPGAIAVVFLMITALLVQTSFEARRTGRTLNPIFFPVLLAVLAAGPIVLAGSIGPAMGRFCPPFRTKRGAGLTFVAIRPQSSAGVVTAKFQMALAASILCCIVSLAFTTLCFLIVGPGLGLTAVAKSYFASYANPRGLLLGTLGILFLPTLTWRQLTGGFAWSLTGRRWIADASSLLYALGMIGIIGAGLWLANHPNHLKWLSVHLPDFVTALLIVKLLVSVAAFKSALQSDLIDILTVVKTVTLWILLTASGCLFALALPGTGSSLPIQFLIGGIAAWMPLSRFPLSVLAFEWNRHR